MFCPNCGSELENNVRFCGECGEEIPVPQPPAVKQVYRRVETTQEPSYSHFTVKETKDASDSETGKSKVEAKKAKSGARKKFVPLIAVGSVLVAAVVTVLNIHTCEECDEIYFGTQNEISFFGETEKVCRDCYDDFYDFSSWF